LHVTVIVTGLGERKSDISAVKSPTAKVEPQKPEMVTETITEKVTSAEKPEGNYLDIPAFLRKQTD
jgi:cell division protein FtsZ